MRNDDLIGPGNDDYGRDKWKWNKIVVDKILKQLKGQKPTEQDKSIMIKLTPVEIFNIAKMGAEYWSNAVKNKSPLTIEEVCQYHVDVAIAILKQTDPDRFINQS